MGKFFHRIDGDGDDEIYGDGRFEVCVARMDGREVFSVTSDGKP